VDVFVLRHAIAEDAMAGQLDPERRLTAEGMAKLRLVVAKARSAGFSPGLVLTSPYVRTRQTTEVMLESLGAPCETIVTQNLTPYASVIDLWSEMREYGRMGPLVLVGHNPLLSELVSVMIGSPRYAVEMKKAALACISGVGYGRQPQGRLVWLLTAKLAGV
jgi:phosphohistidine phosphatase